MTEGEKGTEVPHITIKLPPETSRLKEIRGVVEKARAEGIKRIKSAERLSDYLRWHKALNIYFTINGTSWMWDFGGTTAEELISGSEDKKQVAAGLKEEKIVDSLKKKIDNLESKEGMVRMAIKRVRENDQIRYRVLTAFPKGVKVYDPIEGSLKTERLEDAENIIYFEPENACVLHNCDLLYRSQKEIDKKEGKATEEASVVFYMPYMDQEQAGSRIVFNQFNTAEFVLSREGNQVQTQNAEANILLAVMGGFNNEVLRIRVSDFWNRKHSGVVREGK